MSSFEDRQLTSEERAEIARRKQERTLSIFSSSEQAANKMLVFDCLW